MKHFHVAAGILRDSAGRILITERRCDGPFDGLWEFPGGKVDAGESPAEALHRELAEELGIKITASQPYMELHHEYPDRSVDLEFFLVTGWQGEPRGLESQVLRWVLPSELNPAEVLPADEPVLQKIAGAGCNA